jgi:hypothetical protein
MDGGPGRQATNTVVTRVPQATPEEMREATKSAAAAFKTWKQTTPLTRQRLMLDLQLAVRDHTEAIAASITKEQGKTLVDARGDVLRGLRTPPPHNSPRTPLSLCPSPATHRRPSVPPVYLCVCVCVCVCEVCQCAHVSAGVIVLVYVCIHSRSLSFYLCVCVAMGVVEVVEHACSIPTLLMGEYLQTVATDMDTYSMRQPLGVTAGICPYVRTHTAAFRRVFVWMCVFCL